MFTTTAIPSVRRRPLFAAEQDKWLECPDTSSGAVDDMTHILCCPPVLLGDGRLPPRTSSCFGGTRSLPLRCLSRGQKNHLGARILTHRTFHRTLQSLCEIHSKHNFAKSNENASRAPSPHPTVILVRCKMAKCSLCGLTLNAGHCARILNSPCS